MNRRERKQTEKVLGLTKHYKTLSRSAKWDLQAERITLGKQRQEEFKETVRQSVTEQNELYESKMIDTIANTIAANKKISVTDAIEEAKQEYSQMQRKAK
jgi:hypothetical protein